MQTITDSRFPTDNIYLAAALAALHIPVKSDCPCLRTRNEEGRTPERFSFFFETKGVEFCGEEHESEFVSAAWSARAKFEAGHRSHPLVAIRRGLDAFLWIQRAAHGDIPCGPARGRGTYGTDDWALAACWKGAGGRVLEIVGRKVVFDKAPTRNFLTQFDKWNHPGNKETDVALMRRGIECRAVLKELYIATRERLRRVIGDREDSEWSELLYFSGTPEGEIQSVENEIL